MVWTHEQHYRSVFRSGFMLGIGLPAAVIGLVAALSPNTPSRIPTWDALLQVYSAIYMPVFFTILFELNLDAWVMARINYEVSGVCDGQSELR